MAYVGTPRMRGDQLQTLASIIQGEAGGEGLLGMQAVADVIRNRAGKNFSGYGSGLLDQALARNQFQGQSSKIGPEALRVAQQLQDGTLPDAAGSALYYANPGASTAAWARNLNASNALKIGNHYFTDNANGVPFAGGSYVGPDGPKGQESYPSPADPAAPQQGGMMADTGIPQGVADYAASDDNQKSPLASFFERLGNVEYPAPPRLGPMGDARETGGLLLKALAQPGIADYLFGKRTA
jgi:hypothetical protein